VEPRVEWSVVRISMLGPLRVQAGRSMVHIGGRQLRLLLSLLALEAGRVVPAAVLAARLWSDAEPADPGNALQTLVSRLRAALRPAGLDCLIESHPSGYRLGIPPEDVDILAFEAMAGDGSRALAEGDAQTAARALGQALDLWYGQPLADAAGCEFAVAVAVRLDEARGTAAQDRIEAELVLGEAASLVAELKSMVAADPLAERPRALLMRALYAAGRQAESLAVYAQARELLADRLGVDPGPALEQVYLRILRGKEPISERPVVPPPGALIPPPVPAPLTSFVGRDQDLTLLLKLLAAARLVTLTGPGGVGKTRLASELPARLDVCSWFVELAPVTDPAEVVYAVLNTLGIRGPVIGRSPADASAAADPAGRLTAALAARDDVLILDNCEHVIDAAAALAARVLAACPRIRIITTSREPLRIDGESLCPVSPLPFPPSPSVLASAASALTPAARELADLSPAAYASVQLLCDRGAAVRPGFGLDDGTASDAGNGDALARICRTLDGMPLAIELAAVWLRVLSPAQLAERLDDRFALLTGGSRTALPRHQTLRAVVDWSWELLSEQERVLTRRLSVFPAGATLAAAEQVCAGEGLQAGAVLAALSGVVDKSILAAAEGERYLMLETVRAYCQEQLVAAGEMRQVRDAFAGYYLNLAEKADPGLRTADQRNWLRELAAEQDNLHAALRWTISQRNVEMALRFIRALGWYWMLRGQPGESQTLSREVLALGPGGDTLTAAEGRVVCTLTAAGPSWDVDSVRPGLSVAVDVLTTRSDGNLATVHPIAGMGIPVLALADREPARALALFEVYATSDDPWMRAAAPFFRGMFRMILGETDAAEADIGEAIAAFRDIGDAWGMAVTLVQLADLAELRGEHKTAVAALAESESLAAELGAWGDISQVGGKLAMVRMRAGDLAGARADLERAYRNSFDQGNVKAESAVWLGLVTAELRWCEGDMTAAGDQCAELLAMLTGKESLWWDGFRAQAMARLAAIELVRGDVPRCRALLAEALRTGARWVERLPVAAVIDTLAALAQREASAERENEEPELAATLLGAAHSVRGAFDGASLDAPAVREAARRELGDARFEAAYQRGRDLGYEQALDLAARVAGWNRQA
jgi:predicted ATPase/DNA-binding SARP family transcriptional activator